MSGYTRDALKAAFLKLLDDRPLSQITVADIARECGVNRNSFYYHYSDVPSLIQEIVKDEADRVIVRYNAATSLDEYTAVSAEFMRENRRAVLHIYNSVNRDIFDGYLWRICKYVSEKFLESMLEGRSINAQDRSLLVRFHTCLVFGLFSEWLSDGMRNNFVERNRRELELHINMLRETIAEMEAHRDI